MEKDGIVATDVVTSEDTRIASLLNGEIVSDSESDDEANFAELQSSTSPRARDIVSKNRKALSTKTRQLKALKIPEKNFLGRRRSKCVQSVVMKLPDIEEAIESFVSEANGNYKQKFSYGTVVQLCIARNKHRNSAKNYKGVAKVTTRRAQKGSNYGTTPIDIGVERYTDH